MKGRLRGGGGRERKERIGRRMDIYSSMGRKREMKGRLREDGGRKKKEEEKKKEREKGGRKGGERLRNEEKEVERKEEISLLCVSINSSCTQHE